MTGLDAPDALPPPEYHPDTGGLRFWVATPQGPAIGAILSKQLLQHRFQGGSDGPDAVATYQRHRADIDAAVLRRVAGGSIEPVMLREHNLPPRPREG
jgi:hypothetical protein